MEKIVESLNFENCANCHDDIYIRTSNALVHIYRSGVRITDLINAGKRGQSCNEIAFYGARDNSDILNFLMVADYSIRTILNDTEEWAKVAKQWRLDMETRQLKAVTVYSPFQLPPKLKSIPKRWTIELARRAIANEQGADPIHEKDFDGMTDSHIYPRCPSSFAEMRRSMDALHYGVHADSERVYVGNSASEYSFIPHIE